MTNDEVKVILDRLDALEAQLEKLESGHVASGPKDLTSHKPLSLSEFLQSKKAGDDVKKTLVIGYYLERLENFSSFNTSDLLRAFERAKERKPVNINDKVNMNIRNGHFAEASKKKDSRKAWYITNSGEQFVQENLKAK